MKSKKTDLIKSLLFTISKSFALNFILAIIFLMGFIFNLFPIVVYKVLCIFFLLEVLSVDANIFFK